MGKCQWKPSKRAWDADKYKGCPHESHGDLDFCIFHIPLEEKREKPELSYEFTKAFDSFFDVKNLKDDAGDFRGFVFPDGIDLSKRDFRRSYEGDNNDADLTEESKPVSFQWAIFGNLANFSEAKFGDKANFKLAEFGDEANFKLADFSDEANFQFAKFGDMSNFRLANFGDKANFGCAEFEDFTIFVNTRFGVKAKFWLAIFGDETNLEEAIFGDKTYFWEAKFGDKTYFGNAEFLGLVDFYDVKSSEIAFIFSEARLSHDGDLNGILKKPSWSGHLYFRGTKFNGLAIFHDADLSRVRFELVDLQNLSFLKSKISQTEFVACQWGSGPENRKHWHRSSGFNLGFRRPRLLLDELIWRKQNQKPPRNIPALLKPLAWLWGLHISASSRVTVTEAIDKIDPTRNIHAEEIEALVLQLKQSLEATKDPITAGDFHFAVMEMKLEKARAAGRFWRSVGLSLYKFIKRLWRTLRTDDDVVGFACCCLYSAFRLAGGCFVPS
jgi:uncharacterized protein YjbI with pentapeptide repeats